MALFISQAGRVPVDCALINVGGREAHDTDIIKRQAGTQTTAFCCTEDVRIARLTLSALLCSPIMPLYMVARTACQAALPTKLARHWQNKLSDLTAKTQRYKRFDDSQAQSSSFAGEASSICLQIHVSMFTSTPCCKDFVALCHVKHALSECEN